MCLKVEAKKDADGTNSTLERLVTIRGNTDACWKVKLLCYIMGYIKPLNCRTLILTLICDYHYHIHRFHNSNISVNTSPLENDVFEVFLILLV